MKSEFQKQYRIDQHRKLQLLDIQLKELEMQLLTLTKEPQVEEYISLLEKLNQVKSSKESITNIVEYIEKKECADKHGVMMLLARIRDFCEERTYYECRCLNCGSRIELLKTNMELDYILDGERFFDLVNFETMEDLVEMASKDYRLYRNCYYKYPQILKDDEHKDKMIYKAMRKRYENRTK